MTSLIRRPALLSTALLLTALAGCASLQAQTDPHAAHKAEAAAPAAPAAADARKPMHEGMPMMKDMADLARRQKALEDRMDAMQGMVQSMMQRMPGAGMAPPAR